LSSRIFRRAISKVSQAVNKYNFLKEEFKECWRKDEGVLVLQM
jgi:hypothetical protein